MSILDLIRRDVKSFVGDSAGFGTSLTFTSPANQTATITGLATKHHLSVDPMTGTPLNSRNVHCSFSEAELTSAGYTVRSNGEVRMIGHRVSYTDSANQTNEYIIREVYPNETIGLITCILGDYE